MTEIIHRLRYDPDIDTLVYSVPVTEVYRNDPHSGSICFRGYLTPLLNTISIYT